MTEDWKDIPGFDGFYQASSLGRIKRIARTHFRTSKKSSLIVRTLREKVFEPSLSTKKYPRLSLVKNGKTKQFFVHSLIAEAFLGPKPEDLQVNHIDGNKSNNSILNLEYVTNQENRGHAVSHSLVACRKTGHSKLTSEDILKIKKLRDLGFFQYEIARVFKVCQQTISYILKD